MLAVAPVEKDLQDNRFLPHNHIRRANEFARVYQKGKTIVSHTLIFRYLPTSHPEPRLGLAVSRKVGKAVKRNLVRRRIREVFRLNKASFPNAFDVVISPRRGVLEKCFEDYQNCFRFFLRKLRTNATRSTEKLQP